MGGLPGSSALISGARSQSSDGRCNPGGQLQSRSKLRFPGQIKAVFSFGPRGSLTLGSAQNRAPDKIREKSAQDLNLICPYLKSAASAAAAPCTHPLLPPVPHLMPTAFTTRHLPAPHGYCLHHAMQAPFGAVVFSFSKSDCNKLRSSKSTARLLNCPADSFSNTGKDSAMEKITLNNGIEMPRLGYGTYQIPPSRTQQCVETALQIGYRLIDTAQCYGNEREVGRACRSLGIERRELFIPLNYGAAGTMWIRCVQLQVPCSGWAAITSICCLSMSRSAGWRRSGGPWSIFTGRACCGQ